MSGWTRAKSEKAVRYNDNKAEMNWPELHAWNSGDKDQWYWLLPVIASSGNCYIMESSSWAFGSMSRIIVLQSLTFKIIYWWWNFSRCTWDTALVSKPWLQVQINSLSFRFIQYSCTMRAAAPAIVLSVVVNSIMAHCHVFSRSLSSWTGAFNSFRSERSASQTQETIGVTDGLLGDNRFSWDARERRRL